MVFLPNLGVNRRDRLCGIPEYASAQSLDFLDLGQKSSFLNWKLRKVPILNNVANNDGGGICCYNDCTVRSSTIAGNEAGDGGGMRINGKVTIENTTIFNNVTTLRGGGIDVHLANLIIRNTTIHGNTGGGLYITYATDPDGEHLVNTLIAGSIDGDDCLISSGDELETNVGNLIQDGTCAPALTGNPQLGELTDNGGLTQTLALPPGSPAINAGSNAHIPATMTTDQRGEGFSRIRDGRVDIGAFEYYNEPTMFPVRTPHGKTVIIMF